MRKLLLILLLQLFCLTAFILQSCSLDELPQQEETQQKSIRMRMDVAKAYFDGMSTRSASSWEDGERIYLSFQSGASQVNGSAVYDAKNDDWTFHYSGTLSKNTTSEVQAYYFDAPSSSTSTSATLSHTTGIYHDDKGSYTVTSGGELFVTLSLAPFTSRIRFKGAAGTTIKVKGLFAYSSYNLSSGLFARSSDEIEVQVQSDGYTPYIYALLASDRTLIVSDGTDTYTRTFDSSVMQIGKSGWMDIPTTSQHAGWEIDGLIIDGHEYVDLGLPSGTLWATCNVGASNPEEYGDYYAWGEIETKDIYNWSTYKWCNGTQWTLTKYCTSSSSGTVDDKTTLEPNDDVAYMKWGGNWHVPTAADRSELYENCTWAWTTISGKYGMKVTSKVNGNYVFLPAAGFRSNDVLYGSGSDGYYWCSDYTNGTGAGSFGFGTANYAKYDYFRASGKSVRPVYYRQKSHEYVDLGLPSGTLWATCNIGANKPEDFGDYFSWGETAGYKSGKANFDEAHYKYYHGNEQQITKYCNESSYGYNGFTDGKSELELMDDAAYVNWGTEWRMPTNTQLYELMTQTTAVFSDVNGVKGYKMFGRNGQYIFLPAASAYYGDVLLKGLNNGEYPGWYWSRNSTNSNGKTRFDANCLEFNEFEFYWDDYYYKHLLSSTRRQHGASVRAVKNN